jgi:hypothetical protein
MLLQQRGSSALFLHLPAHQIAKETLAFKEAVVAGKLSFQNHAVT